MRYYLTLFFVLAGTALFSQSGSPSAPDSLHLDSIPNSDKVDIGYGQQPGGTVSIAATKVDVANFNQGLISDPMQLVQGKIAGLQVYNRGGNPNQSSLLRLRGTSFGSGPNPLIVIDGIMGASLDNIDPNDIERISLLKDASATAIFGSRASSGAILIQTKDGSGAEAGLQVNYHGQGAIAQVQREVQVMDAAEFRAAGGLDAGDATDWGDEITRTAWSQAHGISLAQAKNNMHFRISANYRDVEGILLHSGFNQVNTRLQFSTTAFNDRLSVQAHGGYSNRLTSFSFPEAFYHAINFNPTAPILATGGNEQYGGYYETIGILDSYNPVSILEQNDHSQRQRSYTIGLSADYQLTRHLKFGGRWSNQDIQADTRAFYAPTSLFRGNANAPIRKGRVDYFSRASKFDLFELIADYENNIGSIGIRVLAGYQQQSYSNEGSNSTYLNLDTGAYDFLGSFAPPPMEAASLFSNLRSNEQYNALFARTTFDWQQVWFANLSLRRDAISQTGNADGDLLSLGVSLGTDLNQYLKLEQLAYVKARLGFGRTGKLIRGFNQSPREIINAPGQNTTVLIVTNSFNLAPELQREINFGLDLSSARLQASFDLYNRKLQDFLLLLNETMEFPRRFINGGEILTRGVELSLGYDLVRSKKTTWNTSLMLSSFQSTIQSYFAPGTLGGDLGFPGQRGTFTTIIREGEPIGQLWGPVYEGVGQGGEPIFADLNGDGQVLAGPGNALDENGDFQNLGNSRPSLELGWANQCSFGNWSVSALFRGAFGHSLVNTPRVFYEPRFTVNSAYNFVNTELAIEGLNTARFSSLYVERADFLRLDFLTIQRKINFRNSTRSLSLLLTGQNLFVLTNYTGVDPEPALVYTDAASDNQATASINKEYLSPGIDSRSTYWPARSLVFGLQFNW